MQCIKRSLSHTLSCLPPLTVYTLCRPLCHGMRQLSADTDMATLAWPLATYTHSLTLAHKHKHKHRHRHRETC